VAASRENIDSKITRLGGLPNRKKTNTHQTQRKKQAKQATGKPSNQRAVIIAATQHGPEKQTPPPGENQTVTTWTFRGNKPNSTRRARRKEGYKTSSLREWPWKKPGGGTRVNDLAGPSLQKV